MSHIDLCAEELQKAEHGALMLVTDLQAALARSTPVESIVLLQLIAKANELSLSLKQLQLARAAVE